MKESLKKDQKISNLTTFQKNKTKFILCDCRSEVLVIDYDREIQMADLAMYENYVSYRNKMSFWQKLRHIYHIIINNKLYTDQIVLNKSQIKEVIDFLSGCI